MISIIEAKQKITGLVVSQKQLASNIEDSFGYVLAEDIVAKHNSPAFNQAAMDGFAIKGASVANGTILKIIGESSAGKASELLVTANVAIGIYTGAKVPDGADTVIPIEKVDVADGFITIKELVKQFDNVRPEGSQFTLDDILIPRGTLINSAHVAIFATAGYRQVKVIKKPTIALIVTGNELVAPDEHLPNGFVYESNSYMLFAALRELGYLDLTIFKIKDDFENIKSAIENASDTNDFVLLTGGISVGKYDFVQAALAKLNVVEHFYKLKQKPGKPMYLGQLNTTFIFGLPGNPAAVYTCFYEYVFPLLNRVAGKSNFALNKKSALLKSTFSKTSNLSFYLKGFYNEGVVEILEGQESYKMKSYGQSNCIVYLPEGLDFFNAGCVVEIHVLPFMM